MKLFVFLCLVSFLALAYAKGIQVNEIDRIIDVSGFNVRHQTVFDIKNTGSESIKEFLVAFQSTNVAYIKATSNDKNLPVGNGEQKKVDGVSYTQFPVTVNLASGASASVTVYATLTHAVSPLPSKTSQSQPDRLALEDSHYVLSPYPVKRQETTVNGASSWIKFTELEPTKEGDDHSVTFGPYTDIKPFQHSPLFLHFINRAPLIEIKDLVREIEVSHWGNVAVEETFELRNAGAELNHGFSRINYMHGQTGNSFNEFTQILPKDATDVYYRDVIGNISSSHVSFTEDGERVKFEITPRFVLFGGWRITYYSGYNLDASNYISVENGKYVLSVDLGVVFQEDFVVDNLEVRVILPEGATDIKLITPFHIHEKARSLRQTYLDTTGRPVLTFTKSDFIADLNQKFQVSYNLSTTALLKEPLLLVAGYFAFFLAVIFLFRFELTITKTSSESHAQQLQAESLVRKALAVVESRKKDQEAYDQSLERYVSSKKEGNYKSSQQTFTLNEKAKHDQIDELINQLRDVSPRSSNLLKRIEAAQQKKLQALRDYHNQQIKGLKATSDSQKAEAARSEQALHSIDSEIDSLIDELRNEL